MLPPPLTRSRRRITLVRTVTISSTKMTGFLTRVRGSSLPKAEPMAGHTTLGSSSAEIGIRLRMVEVSMGSAPQLIGGEGGAGSHRQMLDNGSKRQRREEGETTNDDDDADDQADE